MRAAHRQRVFIVSTAAFAVLLSITINHGWPERAPARIEEITYPNEITAGEELTIRARLNKAEDPTDCIVGASLLVQYAGKLSFTRWTAQRTNDERDVEYIVQVPKSARVGDARIFMRESYFCENRSRVAFVNGVPSRALVKAKAPDLPPAAS